MAVVFIGLGRSRNMVLWRVHEFPGIVATKLHRTRVTDFEPSKRHGRDTALQESALLYNP